MELSKRIHLLRIALVIIGLLFIFGIYPSMMWWWPSGWRWFPIQTNYEQMLLAVYATLGVFLLLAAKRPLENLSLIWFTVWSSLVHATVMLLQALNFPNEHGHLFGDVPALYLIAIILAVLTPRRSH